MRYDDGAKVHSIDISVTDRQVDIYSRIINQCMSPRANHLIFPLMICEDGVYRQRENPTIQDVTWWTKFLKTSEDEEIKSAADMASNLTLLTSMRIGFIKETVCTITLDKRKVKVLYL